VLLIDNDPQFNATSALLTPNVYIEDCLKKPEQKTIYHIYERKPRVAGLKRAKDDPRSFLMRTWYMTNNHDICLDLMPSQIELYETLRNPSQKEYLLDRWLSQHATKYDYVLIDCPPTPSVLTLSAFAASDFVVIPVSPNYFATIGLPQFLGTLDEFKETLVDTHGIRPLGLVFTKVPRQETTNTNRAMRRVAAALKEMSLEVPILAAKMSQFTVYEKTLWQSVPVQKVSGRGVRGKSLARLELIAIANELETRIQLMRKIKTP